MPYPTPACTCMCIVCCILHMASLSYCAFAMLLPVAAIVSRVQLCPVCGVCGGGGDRNGQACRKGSAVTPSTNGNELVLHCATWPAANLIQLVGIAMRLNGIYLFNCRAPTKHKALFCLIILLRLREPTCTRTKSISACCCWHCLAFYKNRKVKSIFTCCIALRCATLK